jgi:hypothetical protein
MRKLIIGLLLLLSVGASAQWQQTGSKVRYVNGIGIPTKDTAAGVSADSSQILIRPADSSLYVKYKRTWMRVGGGGGSIAGSGTTNYIPKFTSSSAIGNSQIFDNGTNVGIGTTSPTGKLEVASAASSSSVGFNVGTSVSPERGNLFYHTDGTGWKFNIGKFQSSTFTPQMTFQDDGNIGIGTTSPGARLNIEAGGAVTLIKQTAASLSNGVYALDIDNLSHNSNMTAAGAFRIQTNSNSNSFIVNGLGNVGIGTATPGSRLDVSGTATATNLSVTTNATVGGTVTGGSFIPTSSTAPANGMYLQAANSVSLIANSVERIRMPSGLSIIIDPTSAGDLLVGKTTDDGTDKLQVAGSIQGTGFNQAYLARTTTYTAATNDYFIDCTTGTFTVNLFTAVGNTGRILIIKNSGTGTITVDPNGSQTIDGATTQTLSTQWSRVHIISDGANWKIISN